MVKRNGWEETTFAVLILEEILLLIGFPNAIMVAFFLFGINSSILLPLSPAIFRIGNAANILCPKCKDQDESRPNLSLTHFNFNCKTSEINLD